MSKGLTYFNQRVVVLAFFGVLFILGVAIFRDYGVSTDEALSRGNGQISLLYIFQKLPQSIQSRLLDAKNAELITTKGGARQLKDYVDRDYGVAFELPVTVLENAFQLHDERTVYLFRHFCTFLLCFGGIIAFYRLAAHRFSSWRVGLLGATMLVLSPRLFAESFYNDKDAVFMALFTIAMYTAVRLIQQPTWQTGAWHALACAFTIDVRIMGVLVPLATLAFLVLRGVRGEYKRRVLLGPVVLYVGLMTGLVVIMWPYLWEAPLQNFIQSFRNMSHFRWPGSVLYQGEMVPATTLPWHYALVWIGITTPLLYLIGFLIGALKTGWQIVRNQWRLYTTEEEWQDLLFLGMTAAPLAAVIVMHSVLYDGWRQLYFVYPTFLLVALHGIITVWRQAFAARRTSYWQYIVSCVIVGSLLVTAGQMIVMHPFQNIYFNALAAEPIKQHYELDYWGLSYRKGMEWIASHDNRPRIRVYPNAPHPGVLNRLVLLPADRARIELVAQPTDADYFITNYRWHPQPYTYPNRVFTVDVGDLRILSVFRLH